MKYDAQFTSQFKKDLKLAKKQNKNIDKLFDVIEFLANGEIFKKIVLGVFLGKLG